jgi:hypothetical protein
MMSLELPNRPASHWGLTTIYSAVVSVSWGHDDWAEVWVETETPMAKGDVLVQRHGNRYYPSTVKLLLSEDEADMPPERARQLAAALLRAAEVAEATDVADTDPCGHWAPCDCGRS